MRICMATLAPGVFDESVLGYRRAAGLRPSKERARPRARARVRTRTPLDALAGTW